MRAYGVNPGSFLVEASATPPGGGHHWALALVVLALILIL